MSDTWTDRLSEYLDGYLGKTERGELEAHLVDCAECTGLLAQLEAVKRRAQELEDRPPEQDLWQGVAERIRDGAGVVRLDQRRRSHSHRFQFTLPQLIAAGIVLMLISAGGVWLLRPAAGPSLALQINRNVDSAITVAVLAGFQINEYQAAVAELQGVLRERRAQLDPGTVAALERSLETIDRAMQEAYEALRRDPTDAYLAAHLTDTMHHKIRLLRHAAALASAAS